jgi:hypothetical protein
VQLVDARLASFVRVLLARRGTTCCLLAIERNPLSAEARRECDINKSLDGTRFSEAPGTSGRASVAPG